jgi:hypothetical protein
LATRVVVFNPHSEPSFEERFSSTRMANDYFNGWHGPGLVSLRLGWGGVDVW